MSAPKEEDGPARPTEVNEDGIPPDPPRPQAKWRFTTRLPIQDRMAHIIKLTIEATEKETERLRRKLTKMRLGS